jgi:hypothetical protein
MFIISSCGATPSTKSPPAPLCKTPKKTINFTAQNCLRRPTAQLKAPSHPLTLYVCQISHPATALKSNARLRCHRSGPVPSHIIIPQPRGSKSIKLNRRNRGAGISVRRKMPSPPHQTPLQTGAIDRSEIWFPPSARSAQTDTRISALSRAPARSELRAPSG